jgi:hypothetical protein
VVSCVAYSSTLKTEAIPSSSASLEFYRTTRVYNPDNRTTLHCHSLNVHRILIIEILQLPWSHRCPLVNTHNAIFSLHCRDHLSTNGSIGTPVLDRRFSTGLFFVTTLHGPNRRHRFQQYPYCRCVYRSVA